MIIVLLLFSRILLNLPRHARIPFTVCLIEVLKKWLQIGLRGSHDWALPVFSMMDDETS